MKFIWAFSVSLAILLLSCMVDAAAPDVNWEQTFGEGRGLSVQETEDGGYIVAGSQVSGSRVFKIQMAANSGA